MGKGIVIPLCSGGGGTKQLRYVEKSFTLSAKSAGYSEYATVTYDDIGVDPLGGEAFTQSISSSNGMQFSVVYCSRSTAYVNIYCPKATKITITITVRIFYEAEE